MKRSLILFLTTLALFSSTAARADDYGRLQVTEENDKFASLDDRHYTQGLRFDWLPGTVTPESSWNDPFVFLSGNTPAFGGGDFKRQYDWTVLGQSMFTPTALNTSSPEPKDRPYGAWLYTGVSLLQDTKQENHDTLDNAELLVGVVGPMALGSVVQNDWHQFIGVQPAEGWDNQIHNEPGVAATYERKWRFEAPLNDYFSADAIPEAGATLGNVFTYGEAGGTLRFGHNLEADYGPSHIRPSLSGTGWFDPGRLKGDLGWYVFVGTQGRAVGRNIFLDGNTWRASDSVDKKPLVEDFVTGFSVLWSTAVRLDFTVTERTKEFYGQASDDRFGSIGLVVGF